MKKHYLAGLLVFPVLVWLLVMMACQQPFMLPQGGQRLCAVGSHWAADTLGLKNVCVKDSAP